MLKKIIKIIFYSSLFSLHSFPSYSMPAQIIVVPSAEASNGNLTLKGKERAMALAPYLSATNVLSTLLACRPTENNSSLASMQTLAPLGQQMALPVRLPFGVGQADAMASLLLSSPLYDGLSVVLAWEQSDLSNLFSALGYQYQNPDSTPSAYVYILPYPVTSLTTRSQKLLYQDPN